MSIYDGVKFQVMAISVVITTDRDGPVTLLRGAEFFTDVRSDDGNPYIDLPATDAELARHLAAQRIEAVTP